MSELVVQGPAPEIAMDNNPSPKADKTPEASPDAPFTRFIELDGKSPVPSQFRTAGTFTITRLQSPAGLPDRITKLSPIPALLPTSEAFSRTTLGSVHAHCRLVPRASRSP